MPKSPLRLIKACREFISQKDLAVVPPKVRGIYVLYRRRRRKGEVKYDVVYVGMARAGVKSGIRARLMAHRKRKADLWTHYSYFEVWENVRVDEVIELEGLFRHIYRHDQRANRLNVQRGFKPLKRMDRTTAAAAKRAEAAAT